MYSKTVSFSKLLMAFTISLAAAACTMKKFDDGALVEASVADERWYVEYIYERPVIDRSPAYFLFGKNGKVSGNASCNQFMGKYEASRGRVTLSDFVTTRRSCIGSLEEQERRFLGAVSDVVEWKIEQGLLLMLDAQGRTVFQSAKHVQARK